MVLGVAQYDGRPSPQLAARLDHVVTLWNDDVAPTVVVTGGNQPGDRFTEAEASQIYLVDRGVPEQAILMEDEGTTTYESLAGVAELLERADVGSGDGDPIEVVVVTDPYHAYRSKLTAEEVGLHGSCVVDADQRGHGLDLVAAPGGRGGRRVAGSDRRIRPAERAHRLTGRAERVVASGWACSDPAIHCVVAPSGVWCNWQHESFWFSYSRFDSLHPNHRLRPVT